jgi:serine/threonine protein phosphatase PrpC
LKNIVVWLDRKLHADLTGPERQSGCTLILLVFNARTRQIAIANVGDSRAVLQMAPPNGNVVATRDHKPTDAAEMLRVARAGSYIIRRRVAGILAMTRAMGDFSLKTLPQRNSSGRSMWDPVLGAVSALPDVQVGVLGFQGPALAVLACDGVWDVMESAEALAHVRASLAERTQPATDLVNEAFARGSSDNITALVLHFPKPPR